MQKYFLIVLFLLSSCAIEGEVFRLQTRINAWHQLLDDSEELLFAQNNITELGKLLDQKETQNAKFQQQIRDIRIEEAIMSFDGEQTAHFFYNILLRDLAKFSYEEFMNSLTPQEKIEFITNTTPNIFSKQEKILNNAQKYYGFQSFNDQQILQYYRTISFPVNFYPLVYDVLAFLARYRSMELFLEGDVTNTLAIFENIKQLAESRRIPIRKQGQRDQTLWQELKQRSYLESLSDKEFLEVLFSVLPELDNDVRIKTIDNIRNRFKES